MGRANRLANTREDGGVFHVTHRCHNRAFLLKFARDRDRYRERLREHALDYNVAILDYCITCNHVHLLVDVTERLVLGRFMQEVASEMAREYNRRKGRTNAFWGDNYHASLVEDGPYLWGCLCYLELNMVRCGVVTHPREWAWVGYHEILGLRRRYRLLDLDRLCWRLQVTNIEALRLNLEASLMERIARADGQRESCWTESLAVGSQQFVKRIKPRISNRQKLEIRAATGEVWVLQEAPIPYGQKAHPKIRSNASK